MKRSEKILISLVLLSGCFLGEKTLYSSMQQQAASIAAQLTDVRQSLDSAKAEKDSMASRRLASVASFPPMEELSKLEASSSRLSAFLKEITDEEEDERFGITRLSTEPSAVSGSFVKTPVNIEVEASFPAVGRFLEHLEDSPLLAEIDSIELSRVDNDLRMVVAKIRMFSYTGAK
jgi:Tfp pilus assembly protein PilO